MTPRPVLFVVGGAKVAGDPLDPLADLQSLLAHNVDIEAVRPGGLVSFRGLIRRYRPGIDAILYDLTDGPVPDAVFDMMQRHAGIVLVAAGIPRREGRDELAAWRRVMVGGSDDWPGSYVIALDCAPPLHHLRLARPVPDDLGRPSRATCAVLGGWEAQYAAMLGWQRAHHPGSVLRLISAHIEDALRLRSLREQLGLGTVVEVRIATSRLALSQLVTDVGRVVDINPVAWPGITDAMSIARRLGCPVLRLDTVLEDVPDQVADFLDAQQPASLPQSRFAADCAAMADGILAAMAKMSANTRRARALT